MWFCFLQSKGNQFLIITEVSRKTTVAVKSILRMTLLAAHNRKSTFSLVNTKINCEGDLRTRRTFADVLTFNNINWETIIPFDIHWREAYFHVLPNIIH